MDIDKLFLSRLFINPETIKNPDQMFTFFDDPNATEDKKIELLRKGYTNDLFKQYITLLMDKQSAKTKWRPIDADTELWEDVYDDLYPSSSLPIESMSQDTIAYQTEQKNSFVVGKIGIGPFALNNNNHIYTMLYGISLGGPNSLLRSLGDNSLDMGTLSRDRDIYKENSILSWLSGGINAHVDIAKNPFVTKLNVNKYTYNITNFLIRAGFGRNGLWFLNLPVIKELAHRMNGISGQYLKQSSKSEFEAQEELMEKYKQELIDVIPLNIKDAHIPGENPILSDVEGVIGRTLTIADILYNRDDVIKLISYSNLSRKLKGSTIRAFRYYCEHTVEKAFLNDMVLTDKNKSILYRTVKGSNTTNVVKAGEKVLMIDENVYNYIAVLVFESINKNEAKTTSDLTKFAKIDTKKQGSTVAAQIDFLSRYEQFVSECLDGSKVNGDVFGFFGLLQSNDILGFDTSLMLYQQDQEQVVISGGISEGNIDITEAGYAPRQNNSPLASFIDNKTKKAINALTSIIRNDSVEGTYGFNLIWNRVKSNFGKSSLTEEAQSKLRSTILGAIKHAWAMASMRNLGIDPVSLFRDGEGTLSLAHELVNLKTKMVRYEESSGRNRFTSVAQKYKNNALLNMLFDGHVKDEYAQTDKVIEILDFIKIHVPFTDDSKKSNVYIRAWRELYNDPVTKDFAVKLMFYSFLTSNDTGGNNIFKYVPFEMLLEYGLFDAERLIISLLGDPSVQFAKNNSEYLKVAETFIKDIVDRVESILVEDFEFSTPLSIESKLQKQDRLSGQTVAYNRKEYTGFGSKFGNNVVKNGETEETDRIPYVFLPIRMTQDGRVFASQTMSRSTKNGVIFTDNQYIRVLNPVANYENSLKYLVYKKIGEVRLPIKGNTSTVPIYLLVDNCMYKIGPYKVYNYNNEMRISSSLVVANMKKYTLTSPYSMELLDQFINDAVSRISRDETGTDPEQWSKLEGWSVEYFLEKIYPDLDKYWLIEYELVPDSEPSIGEATMYMAYGGNKRPEVTADTTFDAIINGERTATSRREDWKGTEWWKSLNMGDVITLRDTQENLPTSRRIKVRITRAAHKLSGQTVQEVLSPLYEIDERIKMMNLEKLYKEKEYRVRNVLLPLYDDFKYLEFYLNLNNAGRRETLSDLNFALNAKDVRGEYLFSQEDRILIQNMINSINVFNENLELALQNKKAPNNQNNPATFHMHSGGAYGSDTDWANIGLEWGMLNDPLHISHYYYGQKTPTGNSPISEQDYNEGVNHVVTANDVLNRQPGKYLHLLARNWKLVKESNGIFAIGTIKRGQVDGGTGWAVQMAIDAGKQVHVFDLQDERWYTWNPEQRTFVYESTPRLTKDFAGIGTRSIDPDIEAKTNGKVKYAGDQKREAALKAMRDVFKNTFGEPKKQDDLVQQEEVKSLKTPLLTAIEKAEGFIGETNGSVYLKQGDKFVLKSGTQLLDALKIITDRGHNPGKWSFGDDYDGQVSYNIGYVSGTNAVMSVTNRDLYDEGWAPSTILVMREDNRIENPLDLNFKLYIDQFGKDVTFLVSEKDKPLLEYLNSESYKYEIYDKSSTKLNVLKKVSVSTTTYTSESVKNPRTAVVFTENMQAEYARRNNTSSSATLKLNVTEGSTGTNQAVVRMSDDTTYNPNAFGLIVKKYQQNKRGEWFYDDRGNFQDTDADFTMFKEANEAMFDRLSKFNGDTVIFPSSASMGKAALPRRFAEWLAQELYERYGLFTVVKPNPKYTGKFGIYIYENTGTINVYSKAGNTNLSNFESRPYRTQVSKTYPTVDVNHVEHAFQLSKAVFANQHGDITDYLLFTIQKGMQNASPEECRRIGRSLKMSPTTLAEWNKVSSKMLEAQMRRSFVAHPEIIAELLRTGDAKITHNYLNGTVIDERFGPILEKIRSDLKEQQELSKNCN